METQASSWATGLPSMLPMTCCRHWLTVHSGLAALNCTMLADMMNECRRARTQSMQNE